MIWLRILCDAIGRSLWFAFGGLLCGMIGGVAHGMVLMPLFAIATEFLIQTPGMSLIGIVEASLGSGALAGCLAGGVTGCVVMGIVGLVQGLSPRKLSLDAGFNHHFFGMFWVGFFCLLAGICSAAILTVALALARGQSLSDTAMAVETLYGLWLPICYFGGSLLGALAPDALGKFWRRIKAVLPQKSDRVSVKQNGAGN